VPARADKCRFVFAGQKFRVAKYEKYRLVVTSLVVFWWYCWGCSPTY